MSVQRTPGGGLTLRWPDPENNWQLQFTTSPGQPDAWTDASQESTLESGIRKVSVTFDPEATFYRLRER